VDGGALIMKFAFWKFGFSKEKEQPTQRKSALYHPTPHKVRFRKRGSFAVRTLRELAGKNWRGK